MNSTHFYYLGVEWTYIPTCWLDSYTGKLFSQEALEGFPPASPAFRGVHYLTACPLPWLGREQAASKQPSSFQITLYVPHLDGTLEIVQELKKGEQRETSSHQSGEAWEALPHSLPEPDWEGNIQAFILEKEFLSLWRSSRLIPERCFPQRSHASPRRTWMNTCTLTASTRMVAILLIEI